MAGAVSIAKNRGVYCQLISGCIGHRVPSIDWEGLRLARPGRREVGNLLACGFRSVAMCIFRLVSSSIGVVDIWDSGGLYIWCMERVSYPLV